MRPSARRVAAGARRARRRRRSARAARGSARRRSARPRRGIRADRSRSGSKPRTGVDQRIRLAALEERPGRPLDDALAHAAIGQRDHRPAGRERLDGRDPELLASRSRRAPAHAASRSATRSSLTRPVNLTVGPAMRLQPARLRPVADHEQRQPQRVERAHRDVDALVGHQLREDHVVLADGRRAGSARSRPAGAARSTRARSSAARASP